MGAFEKIYGVVRFKVEWLAVYETVGAVQVAGRSHGENNFGWIEHVIIIVNFSQRAQRLQGKTKENISVNS